MSDDKPKKRNSISQAKINKLNFIVAVIALVISLPGATTQLVQFVDARAAQIKTNVVYYSPPSIDITKAEAGGNCIQSLISVRQDAFRCFSKNLVLDPCLLVEEESLQGGEYLYCPRAIKTSEQDMVLAVLSVEKQQPNEPTTGNGNAWEITLDDNTTCRRLSGAVGRAFGSKGNVYTCNNETYSSVTNGEVESGKYFFGCKLQGTTTFKRCFAKQVVY